MRARNCFLDTLLQRLHRSSLKKAYVSFGTTTTLRFLRSKVPTGRRFIVVEIFSTFSASGALVGIPLRPDDVMRISFLLNAMHNRQCKSFVTKNCRSSLDFHFTGWHQEARQTVAPNYRILLCF